MNRSETQTLFSPCELESGREQTCLERQSQIQKEESAEPMRRLTLAIQVQTMSALISVLTNLSRLGVTVTHLSAADLNARLDLLAPGHIAHRVAPQLRRIVEVIELTELQTS